jgi:hypothetical protein
MTDHDDSHAQAAALRLALAAATDSIDSLAAITREISEHGTCYGCIVRELLRVLADVTDTAGVAYSRGAGPGNRAMNPMPQSTRDTGQVSGIPTVRRCGVARAAAITRARSAKRAGVNCGICRTGLSGPARTARQPPARK